MSSGVIRMLLLAPIAWGNSVLDPRFSALAPHDAPTLGLGLACYLAFIYLDFSGHCNVAIAVANLFGFTLPRTWVPLRRDEHPGVLESLAHRALALVP